MTIVNLIQYDTVTGEVVFPTAVKITGILSALDEVDITGSLNTATDVSFGNDVSVGNNLAVGSHLQASTATITAATIDTLTVPAIEGTTTNNDASTGCIGEYIHADLASGSAISLTSGTTANVTNISLTAGDWDVEANGFFAGATGPNTVLFDARSSVSLTSATLDSSDDRVGWVTENTTTFGNGGKINIPIGPTRISLASTTTVYLVARGNFSTNAMTAWGYLRARRVR